MVADRRPNSHRQRRLDSMKQSLKVGFLALAATAFAVACSSKPKPAPAPAPTPEPVSTPTVVTTEPEPTPAPTPKVDKSDLAGSLGEVSSYLKPAFFEYDKADIRSDARDVLAANATWLKKYPSVRFTIEGHADERGTAQYNLALGDRRANAAKDYVVSLGVDASRIKTVSYGKERPFSTGHDEDSWQKNRRAHFVVTAK
jgi:peptidoglycan-associated lipoprotein